MYFRDLDPDLGAERLGGRSGRGERRPSVGAGPEARPFRAGIRLQAPS